MAVKNIFKNLPIDLNKEVVESIITSKSIRIERIISKGQISAKEFWYEQEENEWVILLSGSAKLLFENGELVELNPGDYLNIPANKKHRVEWTIPDEETIWLTVFYI
jgi:cupin 2 domain-containing protein